MTQLLGIKQCKTCCAIWTIWGPTAAQPQGSMSMHGPKSCASCEPAGVDSDIFEDITIGDIISQRDSSIAQACKLADEIQEVRDDRDQWAANANTTLALYDDLIDRSDRLRRMQDEYVDVSVDLTEHIRDNGGRYHTDGGPQELREDVMAFIAKLQERGGVIEALESALQGKKIKYASERLTAATEAVRKLAVGEQ